MGELWKSCGVDMHIPYDGLLRVLYINKTPLRGAILTKVGKVPPEVSSYKHLNCSDPGREIFLMPSKKQPHTRLRNGVVAGSRFLFDRADHCVLRPLATAKKHTECFGLVELCQYGFKIFNVGHLHIGNRQYDVAFAQTGARRSIGSDF